MPKIRATLGYIALFTGIWTARILLWLLPRKLVLASFRGVANIGLRLFRRFRERSEENLAVALRGRVDLTPIVRDSLRNFFQSFAEAALAVDGGLERMRREVPATGLEHLRAALAKGNGAIVLSAHFGNFLLLGSRLAAEGLAVYTLINHPRGGKTGDLADQYRLKVGQWTIHSHPRKQAFRELSEVLRDNAVAIVIADEFRSGSGVTVPFFGRTVTARRGPATLALRTGAAVVPAYLLREKSGGLRLVIEPEIELRRSGDVKEDVAENTKRMTRWLETTVSAHPEQWNWMSIQWQAPENAEYHTPPRRSSEQCINQEEETR
ncbi:MAG TPA: lysophospholipid acyltransferase family protein [Verrucomicrobiae bacterium]|jgi:KDO2-lipid IV(A) lauroyltransferase|nr:lysophospholipid acyltransferase family protein [Verrucomicrobiae bacterium]